jgi:hypothetical protein
MMLTSLKNMSDGRVKTRHYGIKAIDMFKKDVYGNRKIADLCHLRRNTENKTID